MPDPPSSTDGAGREWPIYVCEEEQCGDLYVDQTVDGFCESDLHVASLEHTNVVPKAELLASRERTRVLEEALRFYGFACRDGLDEFSEDYGERARAALAAVAVEDGCCCGNGEAEEDRSAVLRCPVHGSPLPGGTP